MNCRSAARALVLLLTLLSVPLSLRADDHLKLLATTFPVYQMTRNIIEGREGLTLDLMIPADLGCPHDYALTPDDMHTLARARVLIINGLGMEDFLGAPIQKANPAITIITSTAGISELIHYREEAGHGHEEDHHGPDRDEVPTVNPHLFASPRMAARMVLTIEKGLSAIDPAGQALYAQNAQAYAAKLEALGRTLAEAGKHLAHRRIVTQHGAFDYLARDMGLDIVAFIKSHEGQDPSASDMLKTMNTIRQKKVAAIFTEPQYPGHVAPTLARETGIPLAVIDPVATGFTLVPLNYYETVMANNLKVLEQTLGVSR